MKKRLFCSIITLSLVLAGFSQSGTNSPYSQYGLGILSDPSSGFSRGMNGVGLALHKGNVVNNLNPASYSSVDSLTMIFDAGLSGQITNFKERGTSVNAKNANFEYAVGSFRLLPRVGLGFGIIPLTNIGYEYSTETYLDLASGTLTEGYTGSGGLHQAFIGLGWQVLKPLSIGANMAYVWGSYERSVSSSTSIYINSLSKTYSASVNSYNIELGAQWQIESQGNNLTIGATVGIGHKLGTDPKCMIQSTNLVTASSDTTTFVVDNGLELPMTYGLGLGWYHGHKLFVGADFMLQKWGSIAFPDYDDQKGYALRNDLLKDRYKVNIGCDYIPKPDALKTSYFNRIHYRFGVGYATPYYKINGQDGPKELSVSAGFGIPFSRSVLNLSAQWAHTSAKDLITENTFRINLGLTFNERWFAKRKVN